MATRDPVTSVSAAAAAAACGVRTIISDFFYPEKTHISPSPYECPSIIIGIKLVVFDKLESMRMIKHLLRITHSLTPSQQFL